MHMNKAFLNIPIVIGGGAVIYFLIHSNNSIIKVARKYIGIAEVGGNNRSFNDITFQNKLISLGWRPTYSWCSFFVKLVLLEAIKEQNKKYIIKKYFSGSTQRTWRNLVALKQKGISDKIFYFSKKPKKGSIVFWQKVSNPNHGHVGIVEQFNKKQSTFNTIEGNVKNKVMRKVRKYTYSNVGDFKLLGFIIF